MIILENEKRGDKTETGQVNDKKKNKDRLEEFLHRDIGQGYMDTGKLNGNVHHQ